MIPGNTSSQGKYSDQPTSISATAGSTEATVSFTLPAYDGKGIATYVVTASPGGATASGSTSPITVTGLSNGTAYTFTVTTVTGYGVSAVSSASSSVTPVAPAPYFPPAFPPPPPPPPPCSCTHNGAGCTGNGSNCGCTYIGYTCDPSVPTLSYEYYDCGCSQTCPGTGGYSQAYREGVCGYTTPPPPPPPPPVCAEGSSCAAGACGMPPDGVCTTFFGGCTCFYYG